jgi:hypothetical protein
MAELNLADRLDRPDDVYTALVDATRYLPEAESLELFAKIVFLLANHIGDADVVLETIACARDTPGELAKPVARS